jgi:hypothetical protein
MRLELTLPRKSGVGQGGYQCAADGAGVPPATGEYVHHTLARTSGWVLRTIESPRTLPAPTETLLAGLLRTLPALPGTLPAPWIQRYFTLSGT